MKRIFAALALPFALSFLADAAQAQTVSIITTPVGSFSNSAGAAMAKVLNDAGLRAVVQAQASTGFDETVSGQADFNVSNSFDATFYATGTGEYEGRGAHPNLRAVGSLIPYRVAMHVRADSPYRSIADLKGKRVSSGFQSQKTIGRIIETYLETAGLSYKDVQPVPTPNIVRAADDFMAGRTDVMFFALGSAAIKQANAAVGGLRVLEVADTPEVVRRMEARLPGAYIATVNPAPNIEGLTQPTKLIAFDMVMVVRAELADDVVYKVAKALHDHKDALRATFPPFALFNPQNMAKAVKSVPLHPGALRYYKEIGLLK